MTATASRLGRSTGVPCCPEYAGDCHWYHQFRCECGKRFCRKCATGRGGFCMECGEKKGLALPMDAAKKKLNPSYDVKD